MKKKFFVFVIVCFCSFQKMNAIMYYTTTEVPALLRPLHSVANAAPAQAFAALTSFLIFSYKLYNATSDMRQAPESFIHNKEKLKNKLIALLIGYGASLKFFIIPLCFKMLAESRNFHAHRMYYSIADYFLLALRVAISTQVPLVSSLVLYYGYERVSAMWDRLINRFFFMRAATIST